MSKGVMGLVFFLAVAIIGWGRLLIREFFSGFLNKRSRMNYPELSHKERIEYKKYWNDLTEEEREDFISTMHDPLGKRHEQE